MTRKARKTKNSSTENASDLTPKNLRKLIASTDKISEEVKNYEESSFNLFWKNVNELYLLTNNNKDYTTPFFMIPNWFNDILCILGNDFGMLLFD